MNSSFRQTNLSAVFSQFSKQQTAKDVALADSLLVERHKCTISETDNIEKTIFYDCEEKFVDDINVFRGRKTFSFVYSAVSPEILAFWASYYFGATSAPTGASANEVQTLTRTATGGTFKLSITLEGRTGTTAPIAFDATDAEVKAALTKKGSTIENIIKDGDVTVSGDAITFAGRLVGADLPLLVIDGANLTGGTVTVAETTPGDAKYIPFVRATAAKPLFSFALVDITGVQPAEKFYNAVCGSFEPSLNASGDISLTVGVECNYYAEDIAGFAIPPCINYKPLPTSDCRIQINGAWETLDVFTELISLNDNLVADYGFDSFSPDVIDTGDQPTFSINGQVFGVKSDPLGVIVTNREKAEIITHFGMPGHRFSLIAPSVIFEPQSNSRQFAGTRNRAVISFNGTPARDGVNAPVRAEFISPDASTYLLTS